MSIVEVKGLKKQFADKKVIDDISFTVEENRVFGFLGRNGSGKTTTMKMLLGLLQPDEGNLNICGELVRFGETKTNKYVGFLPDVPMFYPFMTAREYLLLCGEITGLKQPYTKQKSEELLDLIGLANESGRIGTYSRGMKQRLGIAQALLNEPKLLICDEPTSALDPIGRKQILDILHEVKQKTTVIFSTHVLSDVERICDDIAVLHEGKIVMAGDLQAIKRQYQSDLLHIQFGTEDDKNKFCGLSSIQNLLNDSNFKEEKMSLQFKHTHFTEQLVLQAFQEAHVFPQKLEKMEQSLENIFMDVVK